MSQGRFRLKQNFKLVLMNQNVLFIFFLSLAMFACQNDKQNINKSQPENNETN